MLARATALMPADRGSSEASIAIVVVGGPRQSILRPAELARAELEKALAQEALFGPAGIFDRGAGTQHSIQDDALVIEQQRASILLDQLGSIRVIQPARAPRRQGTTVDLPVLIEEEINGLIAHGLGFIEWVLQRVDPVGRISDVVPLVALMGGLGWRTAAENRRDPHSMPMRMTQGAVVVTLTPARRFRTALAHEREIWAEDFTALLARRMR